MRPPWRPCRRRTGASASLPERVEAAAIVAAGPIANFILAIVIFTGIFYVNGRAILLPAVDSVAADSAAEAAGFSQAI